MQDLIISIVDYIFYQTILSYNTHFYLLSILSPSIYILLNHYRLKPVDSIRNVIRLFHKTRNKHPSLPDKLLYHLILPLEFLLPNINFFHLADDVAKLFDAYPVCYSFHTDTDHPHFHFIISTVSFIPGHSCLDNSTLLIHLEKAQQVALEKHSILLNIK